MELFHLKEASRKNQPNVAPEAKTLEIILSQISAKTRDIAKKIKCKACYCINRFSIFRGFAGDTVAWCEYISILSAGEPMVQMQA